MDVWNDSNRHSGWIRTRLKRVRLDHNQRQRCQDKNDNEMSENGNSANYRNAAENASRNSDYALLFYKE
jgi:hypothetical protein